MNEEIKLENFDLIIEELLRPVSETNPAGINLRYEPIYDDIIIAMKADNPALKQGIWQKTLKRSDWRKTIFLCVTALKESKDFQVAVWLVQALLREFGFTGLKYGLKLLFLLTEKYWDVVHPDNNELEIKLAPYAWLDEKFYYQLKFIPLAVNTKDNPYTYESWERINITNKIAKENPIDHLTDYLKHVSPSSFEFHKNIQEDIGESISYLAQLKDFLKSVVKGYCPHFIAVEDMLGKINDVNLIAYKALSKNITETVAPLPVTEEAEIINEEEYEYDFDSYQGDESNGDGFINDIEDAYKLISSAAEYLIKYEPEYPTGFLIKNAISLRSKIPL